MDIAGLKVMLADLLKTEAAEQLERYEPALYYGDNRDDCIKLRAAMLYERYQRLSAHFGVWVEHRAVPKDVAQYLRRLRPLYTNPAVRVFAYCTIRECVIHRALFERDAEDGVYETTPFEHPNGDRRDRFASSAA